MLGMIRGRPAAFASAGGGLCGSWDEVLATGGKEIICWAACRLSLVYRPLMWCQTEMPASMLR